MLDQLPGGHSQLVPQVDVSEQSGDCGGVRLAIIRWHQQHTLAITHKRPRRRQIAYNGRDSKRHELEQLPRYVVLKLRQIRQRNDSDSRFVDFTRDLLVWYRAVNHKSLYCAALLQFTSKPRNLGSTFIDQAPSSAGAL